MTIEEKAKAYDEALEKVKPLYERAKKDDSPIWATYEYLFHELTENEDERIRRDIIHYILYKADGVSEEQEHSWIDYLEKQNDANKEYWRGYREGKQEILDKYAEIERQKEQKPAEWSEEDSDMICEIIDHCIAIPYIGGTLHLSDERKKELKTFLKSLRPQPAWKPSEEQMDALSDAYVEASTFKNGDILESLYNDLEKL